MDQSYYATHCQKWPREADRNGNTRVRAGSARARPLKGEIPSSQGMSGHVDASTIYILVCCLVYCFCGLIVAIWLALDTHGTIVLTGQGYQIYLRQYTRVPVYVGSSR